MVGLLLAAADVDSVWFFIFATIGFICAVVVMLMARALDLTHVGLASISLAGMLAWWP